MNSPIFIGESVSDIIHEYWKSLIKIPLIKTKDFIQILPKMLWNGLRHRIMIRPLLQEKTKK